MLSGGCSGTKVASTCSQEASAGFRSSVKTLRWSLQAPGGHCWLPTGVTGDCSRCSSLLRLLTRGPKGPSKQLSNISESKSAAA